MLVVVIQEEGPAPRVDGIRMKVRTYLGREVAWTGCGRVIIGQRHYELQASLVAVMHRKETAVTEPDAAASHLTPALPDADAVTTDEPDAADAGLTPAAPDPQHV